MRRNFFCARVKVSFIAPKLSGVDIPVKLLPKRIGKPDLPLRFEFERMHTQGAPTTNLKRHGVWEYVVVKQTDDDQVAQHEKSPPQVVPDDLTLAPD
jgi:hypothetical protein